MFKIRTKKVSKYKAKRVEVGGLSFASQLEADLYAVLLVMKRTGEVSEIGCQPSVYLTDARIRYVPDFYTFDVKMQASVWYEAKGYETDVWRIKRRLWKCYGPGPLVVVRRKGSGLLFEKPIIPKNDSVQEGG